jgi:hypothetical protein
MLSVSGAVSVFMYFVLAIAMYDTRGHYNAGWVLGFSAVFCAWCILAFRTASRVVGFLKPEALAWSMVVLFLLLAAIEPPLLYSNPWGWVLVQSLSVIPLLLLAALAAAVRFEHARAQSCLLAGTWISLLLLRVAVLFASPAPHIDVFVSSTHAADEFLAGRNPYLAEYVDIYEGRYGYTPAYVYWPVVLFLQAPSRLIFGDIRMASVLADCVTWLIAWLLLRRQGGTPRGVSAWLLAWFTFPVQLFVLEQSWMDPILVALVTVTVFCLVRERWLWSAIAVGIGLATKQYFAVFAALWGIWVVRRCGFPAAVRLGLWSASVFGLLLAPFLLSDAEAFLRMTVYGLLNEPFRPDSFSLLAHFYRTRGPASSWYYLPGLIALAVCSVRIWSRPASAATTRELARGTFLVFTCVFLFGKQAFCNYYTFAAFFLWLALGYPQPADESDTA